MEGPVNRVQTNSEVLIQSLEEDNRRYLDWLPQVEIKVDEGRLLAGPDTSPDYPVWPRPHDNFHYPLGMQRLLNMGYAGIRDLAEKNAGIQTGTCKEYLLLIAQTYAAICSRIDTFAAAAGKAGRPAMQAACARLATAAPRTFREACQAYWFATVFRIGTATIGRMDQHLYPYYEADRECGESSAGQVRELIHELLDRYESRGRGVGDTLQNITLSGRDSSGNDQTNPITYLLIEEYMQTGHIEPKINIRVHAGTPRRLKALIAQMQVGGTGNCTLFNDDTIIASQKSYGRPDSVAAAYCADGCSEIILDGFGETAFRYIDCVKAIEHTLFNGGNNLPGKKRLQYFDNAGDYVKVQSPVPDGKATGSFLEIVSFDAFFEAYLAQLKHQLEIILEPPYNTDESPIRAFTAATFPGVLETGINPFDNPDCFHTYGLFIGSLGTAANSLAAIKTLVYGKPGLRKTDLLEALKGNFENQPVIRQLCLNVPKFGNDDDRVDNLVVEVAGRFAAWVREKQDRIGRPILPGLYNHLFHHTAYNVGATPDGRRYGDPVGEHLSPTPGTAQNGPSAIINSVGKVNTAEQLFGSTVHMNIPLISLNGIEKGKAILQALNDAFCLKNGCVLNTNVLNAERLREAQENPTGHEDLVVRVWGFSFYFTRLSREMQNHVIERAGG